MFKVLVPTDFSNTSLNAARYAVVLAAQYPEAAIVLYHSYAISGIAGQALAIAPADSEEFRQEIYVRLEEEKARLQTAGNQIFYEADAFPLMEGIQSIVAQQQIDLVVMGISGKGAVEQFIIGSNTRNATRELHVPVLIVPEQAHFRPVNKVLFGYSQEHPLTAPQTAAIQRFVQDHKAVLQVVHITETPEFNTPSHLFNLPDVMYLQEAYADVVGGLIKTAESERADVIVTVPGEYGFFGGLFHRSVTSRLSYQTSIPLLVVR